MSASAREPGSPGSTCKPKRSRRAFAGDVAMAGLRAELAEAEDGVPEPPAPNPRIFGAKGLIVIATAAAAGAVAYLLNSSPEPSASGRADVASTASGLPTTLGSTQEPATPTAPPVAEPTTPAPVSTLRSLFSQSDEASLRERARQPTIKA